jgi:hypothetical protein
MLNIIPAISFLVLSTTFSLRVIIICPAAQPQPELAICVPESPPTPQHCAIVFFWPCNLSGLH